MPPAIPFVAAAASAAFPAYATAIAIAAVGVSAAVAGRRESKARDAADRAAEIERRGRTITVRSAIAARRLVLGRARVSGPLMYAEFVGDDEEYLDTIVALTHGELHQVHGVYIGDEYIAAADISSEAPTTGKYSTADLPDDRVVQTFTGLSSATSVVLTHAPVNTSALVAVNVAGTQVDPVQTPVAVSSVVSTTVNFTDAQTGTVEVTYFTRATLRQPLRVQWAMGSTSQASTTWSGVSTPKWTSNHRLRGVSYVRTLKLIDHPAFAADSGDVGLDASGPKTVYDPRIAGNVDWTSNPALLAAWYRTLPRVDGGMGVPSSWIDWTTVATAANVCDELISVTKHDGTGYENVKRYECHTVLTLDRPPAENLQIILDAMAGDFPFTGGVYKCFAGAFRSATVTLTDADVVADADIEFAPQAGASVRPANQVSATFFEARRAYVQTGAQPVVNSSYVTADGQEETLELDLQASTDGRQANYLMGVQLERQRPALAGSLTLTGRGANMALLDTVQLSLTGYSALAGKTFEVRRRTNQWTGRYPVELREVKSSTYALDADRFTPIDPPDPPDNSALFNVAAVTITGCTVEALAGNDGSVLHRARVEWSQHPQGYVTENGHIQIRARRAGGEWVYSPPVDGARTVGYTQPLQSGAAVIVEARAVNAGGAAGPWSAAPVAYIGVPDNVLATAFEAGPISRSNIT